MGSSVEEVKAVLSKFAPEERAVMETVATLRVENKLLKASNDALAQDHKQLWNIMVVLLDHHPDRELRIHESQFLRLSEEYRIERTFDDKNREVVLKLLALKDKTNG